MTSECPGMYMTSTVLIRIGVVPCLLVQITVLYKSFERSTSTAFVGLPLVCWDIGVQSKKQQVDGWENMLDRTLYYS